MHQTINYMRNKNTNRLKSLLVFALMVCFVLSACAVRKGIQSFFTTVNTTANSGTNTNNGGLKANKNFLLLCSPIVNAASGNAVFKQQQLPVAPSMLTLFFILPGFLLSLWCFKAKAPSETTVTDLSVSPIPLFLKNRLLLI